MKTKRGRYIVGFAVILGFLSGRTDTVPVLSASTTSTNVVLENATKKKKPSLTKKVIDNHNCEQIYKIPPSWVCNWSGDAGEMQTYIYIVPNVETMSGMQIPE